MQIGEVALEVHGHYNRITVPDGREGSG
jgi:hypothetical protein